MFYLGVEFREELQKDGLTVALREEIRKCGYSLGDDVYVQISGGEYLIIDSESAQNSYILSGEGDEFAAYPAYIKLGTQEAPRVLTAAELYSGISGSCERILLDHCTIEESVNISNAGIAQSPEGSFSIEKEFVCRHCVFTDLVDFSNTRFQCAVDFRGTTFRNGGEFRETTFQQNANFDLTTFLQFARFVRAISHKNTHFSGAIFAGDALFYRAIFTGSVGFSKAEFHQQADFSEAAFRAGTVFTLATFHTGADFARAQFVGRADFTGAESGKPIEFTDVRHWPNTIGHWWRHKLLNQRTKGLVWRQVGSEKQPRWLTSKLLSQKHYPSGPPQEATEFFIETQYISEVSNPLFKRYVADMLFIRAFRAESPLVAWLWQWSADYGRSLLVWAFWSAVVVMFFALWYTPASTPIPFLGWQLPDWWQQFWVERGPVFFQHVSTYSNEPLNFWTSVYFSVVTFTTLGFGDIATANGMARIVTTAEVILGYVMLGGLISILAHKLARRS